jgi:hypothetical protein
MRVNRVGSASIVPSPIIASNSARLRPSLAAASPSDRTATPGPWAAKFAAGGGGSCAFALGGPALSSPPTDLDSALLVPAGGLPERVSIVHARSAAHRCEPSPHWPTALASLPDRPHPSVGALTDGALPRPAHRGRPPGGSYLVLRPLSERADRDTHGACLCSARVGPGPRRPTG